MIAIFTNDFISSQMTLMLIMVQGPGAWVSIELPEAMVLSGMKLWFEDGDERQQKFTTVCVGSGEVAYLLVWQLSQLS